MVASEEGQTLTYRHWHQALRILLTGQGLQGFRQTALIKHFGDVDEDELVGYLELLLKEEKVQKFKYKQHIYWRATTNILDDP